jgi:hypothetical protein
MNHWHVLTLFTLAAVPLPAYSQVQIKLFKPYTAQERELIFQEFERIEALPPHQQATHVVRVYRDLYLYFLWDYGNDLDFRGPKFGRCITVLGQHRGAVRELVATDLRGGDQATARHALDMAGNLKLTEAYDEIVAFFRKHDGDLAFAAANALADLGDLRAIPLLMAKDPREPLKYCGALHQLCRDRPADPRLLHYLRTGDANTQYQAAYALYGSRDSELVPDVRRLCRDADPKLRTIAADMGFALTGDGYEQVRFTLYSLLRDKDIDLRIYVAGVFAGRKDPVCARVLLDLLQNYPLTRDQQSRVGSAVGSLSGIFFADGFGPDGWKLTTEKNKQALRRFVEWVEKVEQRQS